MRKRLFWDSLLMDIVPIITVLIVTHFKGNQDAIRLLIASVAVLVQIPIVLYCKKDAKKIYKPSAEALKKMNITRIPCAYEPGRYCVDFKVVGVMLWMGILAPFLASLAITFTRTYTITVLNFYTYEFANWVLVLMCLFCLIMGFLVLPLWGIFGQAMVIANEGNDGLRYLYRGFAEVADQKVPFADYERIISKQQVQFA